MVLPPFLDPAPHRLRNQPVGPRHLRDSPVLLHDLKDHLLLELTTESLCRHNQIIPHLSKQYSFHHCPRNTRHLTELFGQYGSARSALRQISRRLRRQHGLGLVDHLARRIGGTRAGSAGYVWYLTAAGQRLTDEGQGRGARRRFQEPSALFLAHTLAITQARVVIEQAIHAVGGRLARLRTEPARWRSWLRLGGALGWLKPDLEAITATDAGAEDHWLLEVDLDTEHPARLLAKCHDYQAHLASGTFQAQHGYYPQVVWLLTNQARAGRLAEQIAADQTLTPELFKITASPERLAALIQEGP